MNTTAGLDVLYVLKSTIIIVGIAGIAFGIRLAWLEYKGDTLCKRKQTQKNY